jgi:putative restriction endonuclease
MAVDDTTVGSTPYRFDGLYFIEDYWRERGASGFLVWRYRLRKNLSDPVVPPATQPSDAVQAAPRRTTTVQRIVRSTAAAERVKVAHDYRCQICGVRLQVPGGWYAEAAHIRPLGSPHDGPDREDNILCLCPNHHVLFDRGSFVIAEDLTLVGLDGSLRTVPGHRPERVYLAYHREHYGISIGDMLERDA